MYEDDDDIEYGEECCTLDPYTFSITTIEFLPIEKLMDMHAQDKEVLRCFPLHPFCLTLLP